MKEQFLKKWSNWWSLTRESKQLNEAFAKEFKDVIQYENGNDANRLAAAGLRVKLHLADVNPNSYLIPNFHFLPRKGDLIDAASLIDENNFSDEELTKVHSLCWSVMYVYWGKDEFGYFADIACVGE